MSEYLILFIIVIFVYSIYLLLVKKLFNNKEENITEFITYDNGYVQIDSSVIPEDSNFIDYVQSITIDPIDPVTRRCNKYIKPYTQVELLSLVHELRTYNESNRQEVILLYKICVTVSAILFSLKIPQQLFTNEINKLTLKHLAVYMKNHSVVDFTDEIQTYTKNMEDVYIENDYIELNEILDDLQLFITVFGNYSKYKYNVSLQEMYDVWLRQHLIKPYNLSKYKQDINSFKTLLTVCYGGAGIDVPKCYLYFTPAIVSYINQTRRYSLTKLTLVKGNRGDIN